MELLVLIVTTLVGTVLAVEANAWLPHLGRKLIRQTIARFPAKIAEGAVNRWAQEIEADFEQYVDRPLGGFIFALRVRIRGGRDLADELAMDNRISVGKGGAEARVSLEPSRTLATKMLAKAFDEYFRAVRASSEESEREAVGRLIRRLREGFGPESGAVYKIEIARVLIEDASDYAKGLEVPREQLVRFASLLEQMPEADDDE